MHEEYMRQALALAQEAAAHGEVPVGCVIVREGRIVGRGRNRREEKQHTSSHAEMEAIRQANEALGTWRLDDCTLYVTLEPCPMCAGAILNARIPRVYYGARDREMGACGGVLNLFMEDFPHPPALVGGGYPECPYPPGLVRRPGRGLRCLRRRDQPVYGELPQPARPGGRHSGRGLPPGADGFLPKSPINEFSAFRLIIVSLVFVVLLNLPAKRRLFYLFR